MLTFLTRSNRHKIVNTDLIRVLQPEEYDLHSHLLKCGRSQIKEPVSYSSWYLLAHDIETRGYPEDGSGQVLLSAFCAEDGTGLVIDNTTIHNREVFPQEVLKHCFFISHNADFEARWGVATNFLPGRFGCTMVNHKRLLAGQEGFHNDIISVINYWLGYKEIPEWMDKDIREEFATLEHFEDRHILYNFADTVRLHKLYLAQLEEAKKLGQLFMHNSLNSRIIIPIAEAEVTGIRHNSEKWKQITEERKVKAEKLCQELNSLITTHYQIDLLKISPELRKLKESSERTLKRQEERSLKLQKSLTELEQRGKTHLKSYKVSKETLEKLQQELTNQDTTQELVKGDTGVNWTSPKQVLEVFKQIGCPLPTSRDKKTRKDKAGVGKEARNNWLGLYSDSPFFPIIDKFDLFKKIEHNTKAFGYSWLEQYVRNGRAYTLLDSAGTTTGRFSSGSKGKNKRYDNRQQIPSRDGKHYRACFEADEGEELITADYKNCEGVIMIAQSGDLNMKKITELPDQHSYLGSKCWRNVYKHRYERTKDPKWLELSQTYEMNKSTPEKELERTTFKNSGGLFPVAYNVHASKVAATSKISIDEGQMMIDTIKQEIPLVIEYLDSVSSQALKDGYCIHNSRTNSRRWFQPILDNLKYGTSISKSELIEIESASRNSVIQGSNSDLIKEAIASVYLWSKLFVQPIKLAFTVHDELVYSCPKDKAELHTDKISQIMKRTAQKYLIPEISMEVDIHHNYCWVK